MTTSTHPNQANKPLNVLEIPANQRKSCINHLISTLKVNRTNLMTIFNNIDNLAIKLLNQVETLIIEDVTAAQGIAISLDSNYLKRHHNDNKDNCNHPKSKILINVKKISFGTELMNNIYQSPSKLDSFNIDQILQTFACMLKPSDLCLSSPIRPENDARGSRVDCWEITMPNRLSVFTNKWKLQTYTTHGFHLFDNMDFFPETLRTIRVLYPDCPGHQEEDQDPQEDDDDSYVRYYSDDEGEYLFDSDGYFLEYSRGGNRKLRKQSSRCDCHPTVRDLTVFMFDWESLGIHDSLKNVKIEVINIPCCPFRSFTPRAFAGFIYNEHFEPGKEEVKLDDLIKACQDNSNSTWIKKNLLVSKKEVANACICCGAK
ncbi:uncharacterized protein L201_001509 [Kwoniella dendrophila CBS 6074]|uniref:Uncharacterized protein n=1 Tax=Kwoniella dendrophila CBS 6074 TaxID=1295534 RepID=A0AAX4JMI0_9TREE